MPKRGGGGGGNFRRNNRGGGAWNGDHQDNRYNEHDNRDRNTKVQRRVSFKPMNNRHAGAKISDIKIRAQFEEADDDMGNGQQGGAAIGNNNRGAFTKGRGFRRRGSPIPGRSGFIAGSKKLERGQHDWFVVRVPHGAKYDKTFILKSLTSFINIPLITYFFGTDEKTQSIFFYVDDFEVAEALTRADRKIQLPNGFRMIVMVRSDIPRVPPLDDSFKQRIKLAMVKRYNKDTNALNLEKFHCDPDLTQIFCALFRPQIMLAVFDIINENIPGLQALNLNNNKLHTLDHFKCLPDKLPNLKILYLKQNKLSNFNTLDALKGLFLTELVLENNPMRDRIVSRSGNDESIYVSEVRKRLPKLQKLDEKILPPTIGFDVENEIKLPAARASFLCDPSGAEIVRQFLEQYFMIYDSESRQPLLDAYHEHAMFSMTANYAQHPIHQTRLSAYLNNNRNVLRVRDLEPRCRYLKCGRLPVVSFLSELPASKHDPQTFVVDLTLFTPQLLQLTVTGVFKESRPGGTEHIRSFQRTLVIVPAGSGFCIRNEVLHINHATPLQEKMAFKGPLLTPPAPIQQAPQQPTMMSSPLPTIPEVAAAVPGVPDDATKLQMIQAMCATSNMNVEWSRKCLEEHAWDYQRAGITFTHLHNQSKIPPEAFAK